MSSPTAMLPTESERAGEGTDAIRGWSIEQALRFRRVLPEGPGWESVRGLLREPERAFAEPDWLKRGTTCSVVRVDLPARTVVVKRYNLKSRSVSFRRLFQRSRASRCWRVGQQLIRAGVPTPAPLGYAEERIGPFRRRSYVVNEYVDGIDGEAYFRARPSDWRERLDDLADLLLAMWSQGFHHGDLKATNCLVTETGFSLIDLDAAGPSSPLRARRQIEKDRKRIVCNWPEQPELGRYLARRLDQGGRTEAFRELAPSTGAAAR